eukprot:5057442-Amphidinium_carterae.1
MLLPDGIAHPERSLKVLSLTPSAPPDKNTHCKAHTRNNPDRVAIAILCLFCTEPIANNRENEG